MKVLFLVIALVLATEGKKEDTCKIWFSESKLKPGSDCLVKCNSLTTGMDTFFCPQSCPDLCKSNSIDEKVLGRVLYYPGLTLEERKLVRQYPKDAITVFFQKGEAEAAAIKVFNRDAQNDESDAFRHFVWAGLLSKELGPDLAKKFLDAHEAAGRTDNPSRAMDLANNRAGLLTAERLKRENKLTQSEIEKEATLRHRFRALLLLSPNHLCRDASRGRNQKGRGSPSHQQSCLRDRPQQQAENYRDCGLDHICRETLRASVQCGARAKPHSRVQVVPATNSGLRSL